MTTYTGRKDQLDEDSWGETLRHREESGHGVFSRRVRRGDRKKRFLSEEIGCLYDLRGKSLSLEGTGVQVETGRIKRRG